MAPGASKMKKDTEVKKEKDKKNMPPKEKAAPKKVKAEKPADEPAATKIKTEQGAGKSERIDMSRADLSGLLTSLKHQTVAKKVSPEHRENAKKILEDAHQQLFSISAYYT